MHSDPITEGEVKHLQAGVDLRWPASAIWRPGEPAIHTIGLTDLKIALAKGIDDFMVMPSHAIFLVIIYPLVGLVLSVLATGSDLMPLVYPMVAGFALIGPVAAIGLYELSRRREKGLDVSAWHALDVFQSPSIGSIFRLGLLLLAIFVTWLVVARSIYSQVFGSLHPGTVGEFVSQVLTTPAGTKLILVGNTVGILFAALVLVISVVSFPMLVDRNVSAATASRTSIRSVIENPVTMAVWGVFVMAALLVGSFPFFVGLAIILPVLGHSTWHLYRKVVEQ
jgi:uncharacterized membrane protein